MGVVDRTGLAVMGLIFAAATAGVMMMALVVASQHIHGYLQLEPGMVAMVQ